MPEDAPPLHEQTASVLVVDDSRVSAAKLAMAMRALGHQTEMAGNGREALRLIEERSFDVILLDIVMPEMDGYDVLRALKADPALRDIPVIVISSLDDEIGSVAKAIEIGAEDFLPKSFEPAILKARLDASLARKRFRDRELGYLRDVRRLTGAAEIIEAGAFRPSQLDIDDVAARRDALGRLAEVFRGLAQEIYDREKRLDQTLRTLRGILLVIAAGAAFGMTPALGRMAMAMEASPLGLVVWANIVSALFCFCVAAARGRLPRLRLAHIKFLLLWAIVLGCLYRLATFVIAAHVEASMIALIGSSRGFMVFGLAALIAIERPSVRRLAGLGIGFIAVAAVIVVQGAGDRETEALWLALALVLPLLLAAHTLLMTWRPPELDAYATVGLMTTLSAILVAPAAQATGELFVPSLEFGRLQVIIIVLGITSAFALALALELVSLAGAVFASQMAYSQTLAGIAWGMLLLNEQLPAVAWSALALVIIGFWLVEPKRAGEEFTINLPATRRRNKAHSER